MRTAPLLIALAVAGCAATVSGSGSLRASSSGPAAPTQTAGTPSSGASSSGAPSSGAPLPATPGATTPAPARTPAGLAARLRAAAVREHSAHVEVDAGGLTGRADELLRGGTVSALHVTQDAGSGIAYEVIAVGRRAWARLPSFYATRARWVIVSRNSPLAPARNLARSLPGVRATAAPATTAGYVAAATSVRVLGTRSVGGVTTTAYAVVVEARRLPLGSPLRDQLVAAGAGSVTFELDADRADRLVRLAAPGSSVVWTRIDAAVRIAPPPAGQTGRS